MERLINTLNTCWKYSPMKTRIALGLCLFLLFGPNGLGEPASEIEQLIAFLDEKPDVSTVSEAIVYETDEQKRVEYIKQKNLERERQWMATQDPIVQLAAMGDMAVDPIVRKLKSRDYSMEFLEPALQVLEKINTPKSQQVLLSIALGKDGFESPRNRVIKYYVRNLQDKSKATIFLKSDNDSLIRYVLDGLCGASLDDALFSCIETLMLTNQGSSSSCFSMKDKTARVLAADPNMALADRKMKAMIAAMETVEDMPKAHIRFQDDRCGTTAGNTYYSLTEALIQVKGLTADSLKPYLEQLEGRPKLCIEIVLANKGKVSVKESLKNTVLDIQVDLPLRMMALRELERITASDDIPYFEQLSKTDPVEVYIMGERVIEMLDGKPLVKLDSEEEKIVCLWIESLSPISKSFPIRNQCRDIAFRLRAKSMEIVSEINRLMAALEKKPIASSSSETIANEPDEDKRFEYLQQKWQDEAKRRQAVQDVIDQLAAMGDMAVDPIVRKMKSKDRTPEFTGYALMVLGKMNTPKSQQALLSIATGKNGFSSSMSIAIEYYVKNLKDKSQAIVFLKSNDDGLIEDVLKGLRGSSIDDPLFSSLENLMQSNRFDSYGCVSIKEKTARILASDPNVALANRKMKAIVAAMETVEDIPGAHDRYQDNMTGTTAGITYSYLTEALIQVKGLTADSLKPYLEQLEGRPKLCVEIVLADNGDTSVKESLRKSVLDIHVDYLIRRLALEKLEHISTHEDLPYFEELSKTDPVEVYIIGETMVEMVDGKPLFKMDEEELEFLNLRLRSTMPITKCFPIRDQCRDIAFRLRP